MSYVSNSGWELHADGQYTVGSQLTLPATTDVKLTIDGNGALTNLDQAVLGMGPLWDSANNKALHTYPGQLASYRLFMIVTPGANSLLLDIKARAVGGSVWFVNDSVRLAQNSGTPTQITRWYPIFADAGTVANGVEFIVQCSGAATLYGATILCINEHLPRFGS